MPKLPLENPKPDIENFIKVIRGEVEPDRPPLVELFLDREIVCEIAKQYMGLDWDHVTDGREAQAAYLKDWIEVHYRLGYDYMRMSGGLDHTMRHRCTDDTAQLSRGIRGWAEENTGPIASWEDFESYEWPDPAKGDLWPYEFVAQNLPEGMGLLVCPSSGFYEIAVGQLLGYENCCYLLYDDPKLVDAVFQKTGEMICGFYEKLWGLPNLYGVFQGDDMGHKTGTLISAKDLRTYCLPWHKKLAARTHDNGLVYLLHSCGNIDEITEDLIEDVGIDGRHSFEDEGNSVLEFERKYGERTAVLGGIDVDKLCRLPEDELRAHTRMVIEKCLPGGRFALGSGNSVTNYIPVTNYLAMVEEALGFGGV